MTHPRGAVFIDVDETIYPGSTIKDVGRYLLDQGKLSHRIYFKLIWWLLLRKLGRLNDEKAFGEGIKLMTGWRFVDLERDARAAYAAILEPRIPERVWQLARTWRKHGPLVLATESLRTIVAPLAEDLNAAGVLATDVEVRNGVLTGRIKGRVLRGEAKNAAVQEWARRHNIDLAESYAVGARLEDEPLLALVGYGIVINPDRSMTRLAQKRGWEIIRLQ